MKGQSETKHRKEHRIIGGISFLFWLIYVSFIPKKRKRNIPLTVADIFSEVYI